ncbi:MAG: hypothetical protein ACHQXA_00255 [Gemmatimonadales bacterium]
MTLPRLISAWIVTACWFGLVHWALARWRDRQPAEWRLRGALGALFAEALLLTLFAALWFQSLGHGGWWLLFLILGALMEGPVHSRHRTGVAVDGGRPWLDAAAGIGRCVIAGGLLSWRLS